MSKTPNPTDPQRANKGSAQPTVSSSKADTRSVVPSDVTRVLTVVRSMLKSGQQDAARTLLQRLIEAAPEYDEPWLQLLALEPPPAEEVAIMEAFLSYHPTHRYADAFKARLNDMRIVAMLGQQPIAPPSPQTPQAAADTFNAPPAIRLGDFLIARRMVTVEQVEYALREQQRLRQAGIDQRLGTILLRNGHLRQDQLAVALAEARATGLGELGAYLIRKNLLTSEQVGKALARQAAIAAENERDYLSTVSRLLGGRGASRKPVPKLGEVIVSMGLLSAEQVEAALREREIEFNTLFD